VSAGLWQQSWRRLQRNKPALAGAGLLLAMIVLALLTPWIAPWGYEQQNLLLGATPPSAAHWLGTDVLGRDMLTRILYGGRLSLAVGFIATALALIIGVTYGAVAGYMGGTVDALMMRLVDILYALPIMIFIILLMVLFGRSLLLLFLAIGAVEWMTMARTGTVTAPAGVYRGGGGYRPATGAYYCAAYYSQYPGASDYLRHLNHSQCDVVRGISEFSGAGGTAPAEFLGAAYFAGGRDYGRVSLAVNLPRYRFGYHLVCTEFSR
jgi:hypothetical protein